MFHSGGLTHRHVCSHRTCHLSCLSDLCTTLLDATCQCYGFVKQHSSSRPQQRTQRSLWHTMSCTRSSHFDTRWVGSCANRGYMSKFGAEHFGYRLIQI
eukprot:5453449-Amphidinium_carterae.1